MKRRRKTRNKPFPRKSFVFPQTYYSSWTLPLPSEDLANRTSMSGKLNLPESNADKVNIAYNSEKDAKRHWYCAIKKLWRVYVRCSKADSRGFRLYSALFASKSLHWSRFEQPNDQTEDGYYICLLTCRKAVSILEKCDSILLQNLRSEFDILSTKLASTRFPERVKTPSFGMQSTYADHGKSLKSNRFGPTPKEHIYWLFRFDGKDIVALLSWFTDSRIRWIVFELLSMLQRGRDACRALDRAESGLESQRTCMVETSQRIDVYDRKTRDCSRSPILSIPPLVGDTDC
jgi:hypothetical protein